ncbi:unnamed protein product [Effrenium voratum]|nr:unnamed protein product [Effrenium voratum]CAJ1436931.1 unnamed protein product [Effrenium voratum]
MWGSAPCSWYNVFDLSTSLAILVLSAMLLPLMLIFAGLVNSFRAYFRGVEAMRRQLEEFRLADAMCHCCSRGHEEQPKKCDRDLLSACVGKWFGSVEEFEVSVRTQVASTLDQQLGAHAFPYCWLLAATSPISWMYMGLLMFNPAEAPIPWERIGHLLVLFCGYWLGFFPFMFVCGLVLTRKLRTKHGLCKDILLNLGVVVLLLPLYLLSLSLHFLVSSYGENDILWAFVFAGPWLLASGVAWRWWLKPRA